MRFSNIAEGRFAPSSSAMNRGAALFLSLCVSTLAAGLGGCKHKADPAPDGHGQGPAVLEAPANVVPDGVVRYFVGGDARNDKAKVLPWALGQAKERSATGFIFLGDMEIVSSLDGHFDKELKDLGDVPFYPTIGNHEVAAPSRSEAEKKFHERFLNTKRTPITSAFDDKVVYSVDLKGGLHFVALDNVSQKGFGAEQLAWIDADLAKARSASATKHIVVGMHKPLAKNGITTHAMDEDGDGAVSDSDAALKIFQRYKVEAIFASHLHALKKFKQGDIQTYISGGLGAPLINDETGYHHVLEMDVSDEKLEVSVLKFPGTPDKAPGGKDDDDDKPE